MREKYPAWDISEIPDLLEHRNKELERSRIGNLHDWDLGDEIADMR